MAEPAVNATAASEQFDTEIGELPTAHGAAK